MMFFQETVKLHATEAEDCGNLVQISRVLLKEIGQVRFFPRRHSLIPGLLPGGSSGVLADVGAHE